MNDTHPTPEEVSAAAAEAGRPVTPDQAALLAAYLDQLIKWNQKMNLVGKSAWREVFDELVVDSLYLADFLAGLRLPASPLSLDLGAGAGLPGIPLRVLWQAGEYRLVEVREKRTLFMRSVLGRMRLPGTRVFHGRAEDAFIGPDNTADRAADLVLSRAFMPWPALLEMVRPLLTPRGVVVVLANDPAPDELPAGWRTGAATAYPVAGGTRYFWSASPA